MLLLPEEPESGGNRSGAQGSTASPDPSGTGGPGEAQGCLTFHPLLICLQNGAPRALTWGWNSPHRAGGRQLGDLLL